MAKKTLKKKVQAKPDLGKLATPVVDSARDIWLAGLGAFSMAQQEGGKLIEQGNKLFDRLVSEGAKLEKKTRDMTGSTVGEVRDTVDEPDDRRSDPVGGLLERREHRLRALSKDVPDGVLLRADVERGDDESDRHQAEKQHRYAGNAAIGL